MRSGTCTVHLSIPRTQNSEYVEREKCGCFLSALVLGQSDALTCPQDLVISTLNKKEGQRVRTVDL